MKKIVGSFVVAVFLFLWSKAPVSAALLTFTSNGELYWNVLGLSTEDDSAFEIKKIAGDFSPEKNESVALLNESGKVYVSYGEGGKVDITEYGEDIVEIEEQDSPSKVLIEATDSGFAIKQKGITAETEFSININSPQNKLSVETPTGTRFLSILPYEVVELITSSNLISDVGGGAINIVEKNDGEVSYEVVGKKYITLFKIFTFEVPISVEVSAISGRVVNVDQPLWYSVVGFFLT